MPLKYFLTIIFMTASTVLLAQQEFSIYEGPVPNALPCNKEESVSKNATGKIVIANVTSPTVTVFNPVKQDANKTAIIVCPGGGYARLASGHEGNEVAEAFNKIGITVFVLKYRLPFDSCMTNKEMVPLQDLQQTIKMVRDRAAGFDINPAMLGVIGFSAGGHLVSTGITKFSESYIENTSNTNLRPDFAILGYPVISMDSAICHKGSRDNLLGKKASAARLNLFSSELQVNAQTPPTFLVHASDDKSVPVENSIRFYQALIKNKVNAEMHIYQNGGHGFGLHNTTTTDAWFERAISWMRVNKFIGGN
jgi:acetyl esterase/lipase